MPDRPHGTIASVNTFGLIWLGVIQFYIVLWYGIPGLSHYSHALALFDPVPPFGVNLPTQLLVIGTTASGFAFLAT